MTSDAAPQFPPALWNWERGYLRLMIRDLRTEVRLGVHAWERHPEKPQRVVVNIELFADDPNPHRGTELESVIDYDYIREAVRQWPSRPHTVLIETLLEELVTLCFRNQRVRACRVSILKPDIFNDAAAAGVELFRVRN